MVFKNVIKETQGIVYVGGVSDCHKLSMKI